MKCESPTEKGTAYGHDWVLVKYYDVNERNGIPGAKTSDPMVCLWACPCGEFKWTSYAEWERGHEIAEPAKEAQGFGKPQKRLYPTAEEERKLREFRDTPQGRAALEP